MFLLHGYADNMYVDKNYEHNCIISLLILFKGLTTSQKVAIEIRPDVIVRSMTDVTVTCRLTELTDPNELVYLKKLIVNGLEQTLSTQPIAVQDVIDSTSYYKTLPEKYRVERSTEGSDVLYVLTIKGSL